MILNLKHNNNLEIETKVNHNGNVLKARSMPQKYHIIATHTTTGEINIFNYLNHKGKKKDSLIKPEIRLKGHLKKGYGLSWSSTKEGFLASSSSDGDVLIWDINTYNSKNIVFPLKTYKNHDSAVNCVSWSNHTENLFASCGEDKKINL
jgi:histone-binding protein RBBP4